jgi:hypothetical protein
LKRGTKNGDRLSTIRNVFSAKSIIPNVQKLKDLSTQTYRITFSIDPNVSSGT